MDDVVVMQIARDSIITMLLMMAPPMLVAMVIGLVISILQAATQVQEMTLSFVPKILACVLSLLVFGPWMMTNLMAFYTRLVGGFPAMIR